MFTLEVMLRIFWNEIGKLPIFKHFMISLDQIFLKILKYLSTQFSTVKIGNFHFLWKLVLPQIGGD